MSPRVTPRKRTGWFGSWRCDCTDVELRERDIPDWCPTHNEPLLGSRDRIADMYGLTLGVWAAEPASGWPVRPYADPS